VYWHCPHLRSARIDAQRYVLRVGIVFGYRYLVSIFLRQSHRLLTVEVLAKRLCGTIGRHDPVLVNALLHLGSLLWPAADIVGPSALGLVGTFCLVAAYHALGFLVAKLAFVYAPVGGG
jgi:hypothetical protein